MPGRIGNALAMVLAAMAGQGGARRQKMMDELQRRGMDLQEKQLNQPQHFGDEEGGRYAYDPVSKATSTLLEAPDFRDVTTQGGGVIRLPTRAGQRRFGEKWKGKVVPFEQIESFSEEKAATEPRRIIDPINLRQPRVATSVPGGYVDEEGQYHRTEPDRLQPIGAGGAINPRTGERVEPFVKPAPPKAPNVSGMIRAGYIPELDATGMPTGKFRQKPRTAQDIRAELLKWTDLIKDKDTPDDVVHMVSPIIAQLQADLAALGGQTAPVDPWQKAMQQLQEAFPDSGATE